MSEYQNMIVAFALAKVGCGYIYGATGWTCTQARLDQQAAQYPEYADMIRQYGPKWMGKPCYDCAQLTKAAAKAAGISIPSGATSQWKADVWAEKGTIDTLPADSAGVFLYRQSGSVMQHTGVCMGDGTFVDARGHAYGVLHSKMSSYKWTHWARLRGAATLPASPTGNSNAAAKVDAAAPVVSAELRAGQARVTGSGNLRLRKEPRESAPIIKGMPTGTVVKVVERESGWARVEYVAPDGMPHVGWCMDSYLNFGE